MDAGNQSSLELIKNLSLNVVKDFHTVKDNWHKTEKKRYSEDSTCLAKSLVAKYFKDAFGWSKYNSSIKRCSFLIENDMLGKLKSIKVLTYRDSMDWWQRTLSESLAESINIYNAEHQNKVGDDRKLNISPLVDYDTQVAMNSLNIKHKDNIEGVNIIDKLQRKNRIFKDRDGKLIPFDYVSNLHDIPESYIGDVPKTKILSQEIEEAINFESLTNIKF